MIYVEILVRRPDGTVIVRLVGDACHALIWDAPAWGPIVAGPGEPRQLAGFSYKPSLVDDAGKALSESADREGQTCGIHSQRDREDRGDLQRASLSTLESARVDPSPLAQWQPIETAPKDERRLLLFNPDESFGGWEVMIGAFYEQLGGWQYDGQNPRYSNAHQPTHWQSLPDPPALRAALLVPTPPSSSKESL